MYIRLKKILIYFFPEFLQKVSSYYQYNSFSNQLKSSREFRKLNNDYNSKDFCKKIEVALLKSQKKNELTDRDGQVVLHKNNNFRVVKYINHITGKKKSNYIIDYGGSLCNFYRSNQLILNKNINWIIFDKKDVINLGKKYFKGEKFNFFSSMKQLNKFIITNNISIDLYLFGSSLQYVDNLEKILVNINYHKCKNILIDRQPMFTSQKTSYCKQKVPFWYGGHSFPVKLYNYRNFINILRKYNFYLVDSFKGFGNDFKNGKYISQVYKKCS
jgi:putative methyltransferase (TIGR04325 family)